MSGADEAKASVLVVGDSICFSRRHKGQRLEESWPCLLERSMEAFVMVRAEGGATSRAVLRQLDLLASYYEAKTELSFTHAVVQVGIVDCCPRTLPLGATQLLDRVPGGSRMVVKVMGASMKKLGIEGRPWIGPEGFRRNLEAALTKLESLAERVALVAIAPAVNFLPENAPGVVARVRQYNEILRQAALWSAARRPGAVLFCDPWRDQAVGGSPRAVEDLVLEDGHHLTTAGHAWVATQVGEAFRGQAPESSKGRHGI